MQTAAPSVWVPPLIALLLLASLEFTDSNQSLFLAMNHAGNRLGQAFWDNMTILGDGAIALALVLPSIRRSPRCFWAALFGALLVVVAVYLCKHLIPVARPLALLPADTFFHSGPRLVRRSFPSGHAATVFTLAGIWFMGLRGHCRLRMLLLAVAVMAAVSRIMVGVHWPADVLAGMLFGWAAAYVGLRLSERLDWQTAGIGGYIAGAFLMTIAAALLFTSHTGYPSALLLQRMLGLACLAAGSMEIHALMASRPWRRKTQSHS